METHNNERVMLWSIRNSQANWSIDYSTRISQSASSIISVDLMYNLLQLWWTSNRFREKSKQSFTPPPRPPALFEVPLFPTSSCTDNMRASVQSFGPWSKRIGARAYRSMGGRSSPMSWAGPTDRRADWSGGGRGRSWGAWSTFGHGSRLGLGSGSSRNSWRCSSNHPSHTLPNPRGTTCELKINNCTPVVLISIYIHRAQRRKIRAFSWLHME